MDSKDHKSNVNCTVRDMNLLEEIWIKQEESVHAIGQHVYLHNLHFHNKKSPKKLNFFFVICILKK